MKKGLLIIFTAILISGISACGMLPADDEPAIDTFEDQTWVLEFYRKTSAVPESQATILFKDGTVSGTTGCNHFSGRYSFSGVNTGNMAINQLEITEMACVEPAGLMEQEAFFIETLTNAQRYEWTPERLMIFQNDNEALTFKTVVK